MSPSVADDPSPGALPEGPHRRSVVLALLGRHGGRPVPPAALAESISRLHPGHPLAEPRGSHAALRAVLDPLVRAGLVHPVRDYQSARGAGPAYRSAFAITPLGQSTLDSIRKFYNGG